VTAYLQDKAIDVVLSSPFKRSYDTVAGFAKTAGLTIETNDDFRERAVGHEWLTADEFNAYAASQWADFSHKLPGGECLSEVQTRNLAALKDALTRYSGKNIVIGTHGTALSTIVLHYDSSYSFAEWLVMPMPWVVKMTFEGDTCTSIEKTDLLAQHKEA